jgi:transposase-like protein
MAANLQNPIFTDDAKAREWLEARVWPHGPVCPHCGTTSERVTKLEGDKHRSGLYQCNECREQFTVTVGTVFERSKLPLSKWLMALFLLMASKKGMSTRQMSRMLGISVKSTWFMTHRLREALRDGNFTGPIGGENKVIESDETYIGGKAKNRAFAKEPPKKSIVLSLVERDGGVRSYHVPNVTASPLGRATIWTD